MCVGGRGDLGGGGLERGGGVVAVEPDVHVGHDVGVRLQLQQALGLLKRLRRCPSPPRPPHKHSRGASRREGA